MDAEISKTTKKILEKQGMKFKLGTKVVEGDDSGETIKIKVEAAKGGKEETVCPSISQYDKICIPNLLHSSTPTLSS